MAIQDSSFVLPQKYTTSPSEEATLSPDRFLCGLSIWRISRWCTSAQHSIDLRPSSTHTRRSLGCYSGRPVVGPGKTKTPCQEANAPTDTESFVKRSRWPCWGLSLRIISHRPRFGGGECRHRSIYRMPERSVLIKEKNIHLVRLLPSFTIRILICFHTRGTYPKIAYRCLFSTRSVPAYVLILFSSDLSLIPNLENTR